MYVVRVVWVHGTTFRRVWRSRRVGWCSSQRGSNALGAGGDRRASKVCVQLRRAGNPSAGAPAATGCQQGA